LTRSASNHPGAACSSSNAGPPQAQSCGHREEAGCPQEHRLVMCPTTCRLELSDAQVDAFTGPVY
jgi:hypothetical protein